MTNDEFHNNYESIRHMENEATSAENAAPAAPVVKKPYDLEERTALYGEAIIRFLRTLPCDEITIPLIGQMVRSGTSIGANYCEADDAVSKKDFRHRISICRKEARETKFWIRMIATAAPESKKQGRILWREAKELHLIFSAIWRRRKS